MGCTDEVVVAEKPDTRTKAIEELSAGLNGLDDAGDKQRCAVVIDAITEHVLASLVRRRPIDGPRLGDSLDRDKALEELAHVLHRWVYVHEFAGSEPTSHPRTEEDARGVVGALLAVFRAEARDVLLGELRVRVANLPNETVSKSDLEKLLSD